MKKVIFIIAALAFTVSFTSCGTLNSIQNQDTEVAGYTLKNKMEVVAQKILNKKSKTVIAIP